MYKSLQILRAIAVWLVVFFHFNQIFHAHRMKNMFTQFISQYGDMGVDIFFVLSGFVMAVTAQKYSGNGVTYFINRLVRILPNYWLYTLLLAICIRLFPQYLYLTDWTLSTLVDSLMLKPSLNPIESGFFPTLFVGWTLIYEMFFYLVLAACLLLKTRWSIAICAVILFLIPITPLQEWVFLGRGHLQLWEFLAGIILYNIYIYRPEPIFRTAFTMVGLVGLIIYANQYGDQFYSRFWASSLVVYFMVSLETLFQRENRFISFLQQLGDYSYSTYLCHVMVIGWYFTVFTHNVDDTTEIVVLAALSVTIFLISKLTYRFIETGDFPKRLKKVLLFLATPIIGLFNLINSRMKAES